MLFMHPLLFISVASLFPRPRSAKSATDLVFTGRPSVVAFMGSGAATLKWWSCTRLDDRADIARTMNIQPGQEQRVDASTPPIAQDGAVAAFEFAEIEGSLSLMRFAARNGPCPVSVRYSPEKSAIVAVAPNLRADARLIMSASVLRHMKRADRVAALRTQLDHPSFFVRWQLMREYISAVGTEAIPDLVAFLEREQNPSVRRSAEATLNILQDAEAKRANA